ncbi:MAG: hypothetical protein QXQ53_03840 [Candidatus Methanosuratincola sp.]
MTYRDIYVRMAEACVNFAYPLGGNTWRVWAGVFVEPATIVTVSHAWSPIGKQVTRENVLALGQVQIWDVYGTFYRIRELRIMPTGDMALVYVDRNGPATLPVGDPKRVRYEELVYMWAYPITWEGYPRETGEAYRYPYWGTWSIGWWEGPVAEGTGLDYSVLGPSMEGQSGAPVVAFQDGLPKVVGVVSATFSVMQGGLLEQSRTYVCSIEHIYGNVEEGDLRWEKFKTLAKAYGPPVLIGAVVGAILLGR